VGRERSPGALEREILACLAAHVVPMTPGEVQSDLPGELAYTTVMTTLARMHTKHAVDRRPRGRAFAYSLSGGADTARASMTAFQMQRLLDAEGDRASVLAQFVAHLGPEDEQVLHELLRRAEPGPS
jgi:predicted transcriptional regulator